MKYILYYDSNYLDLVKYELGKFCVLDDGVGLYDTQTCDICANTSNITQNLNKIFLSFLDLINKQDSDIEGVIKNSIFTRFYHRVDFGCNAIEYDLLKKYLQSYKIGTKVAVRVVYGKNSKFKGLTQEIVSYIESLGYYSDVKQPQIVLSIFAKDKIYGAFDAKENLQSNYRAGAPHYAQNDEISRAEFKLYEAIERFNIKTSNIKTALDLGASPGGWTQALATMGLKVDAVDPANLDERVLKLTNIKHYKMSSQDYIKVAKNRYDLVVNDMKMFGDKSAHIVCNCANLLNKSAYLIMTIKLAKVDIYKQILNALRVLNTKFSIMSVKKLFHNRQEVTVFAQLKSE